MTIIYTFVINSHDPETWNGAHAINNIRHEYTVYVNHSIHTTHQTADWGSFSAVHQVKQHSLSLLWHIPGLQPLKKKDGLDSIITALQGGTCAIIQTVYCVFIPMRL